MDRTITFIEAEAIRSCGNGLIATLFYPCNDALQLRHNLEEVSHQHMISTRPGILLVTSEVGARIRLASVM